MRPRLLRPTLLFVVLAAALPAVTLPGIAQRMEDANDLDGN